MCIIIVEYSSAFQCHPNVKDEHNLQRVKNNQLSHGGWNQFLIIIPSQGHISMHRHC